MKRTLGPLLGMCGAVLLSTSVTLGALFFGFASWLTRVPLVTALVVLALSALWSHGQLTAWLRARSLAAALGQTLASIVVVTALVVGANVMAARHPRQLDVTTAGVNRLSPQSEQVAARLQKPVRITAFYEAVDREAIELDALLTRYEALTDKLTVRRFSPTQDTAEVAAFGIRGEGPRVVVETAWDDAPTRREARFRLTAGGLDHEELLTNALVRATLDKTRRIYVFTGHGESEPQDDGPTGLKLAALDLASEGYEVVELPLLTVGQIPDDASLVVVAGPTQAYVEREVTALDAWLTEGGSALLMLEPQVDAGLSAVLGALGVQLNADVVLDMSPFGSLFGGPDTATGVEYADHAITRPLGSSMTLFPRARSLSINPIPETVQTALVKTGERAWGESSIGTSTRPEAGLALGWNDGEVKGPVPLVAAVERMPKTKVSRVVVTGDVSFIQNKYLGAGANKSLLLNAVAWLALDDAHIAVRPRTRSGNAIFLTPTQREGIAFATLYVMPTALLCLGLSVWLARRRR